MGIRMRNRIQRIKEMGTNSISGKVIPRPPGTCRKIPSNSNSPVVIVMVLTMDRAGVANGDRCMGTRQQVKFINRITEYQLKHSRLLELCPPSCLIE